MTSPDLAPANYVVIDRTVFRRVPSQEVGIIATAIDAKHECVIPSGGDHRPGASTASASAGPRSAKRLGARPAAPSHTRGRLVGLPPPSS